MCEVLKQKGYATACVGKWHLGHHAKFLPTNQGFDSYFGVPYSNDMDGVRGKNRGLDHTWSKNDFTPWNVPLMRDTQIIERPAEQTTLTKRYTDEAVKFIKSSASAKKPFFLYMPHTMPHVPLFVSKDFYDPDPKSAYKKTIAEIDWSVGQVLKALKDAGVDDNTLVVFTTDNGPWHGKGNQAGSAKPLRGAKFSTFEGGMRVPCIMRWPGKIKAGTTCDEIAGTIDLLPTFATIAGAKTPTDRVIDGLDITALLTSDDAKSPRDAYFFYRGNQLQAVRSGQWKLHLPRQANRRNKAVTTGQLYDLSADIGESKNVADAHPDVVKRLTETARAFNEKLQANKRPAGKL